MNLLDLVLIVVLLLHLVNGFGNGMLKMLFDIAGFAAVFVLALLSSRFLSGPVSGFFDTESVKSQYDIVDNLGVEIVPEQMPALVAGLLVFLFFFILLSLIFRLYSRSFGWANRIPVVGLFNRLGGGILGTLVGAFFVYIIIIVLSLIPLQMFADALENSLFVAHSGNYVDPYAVQLKNFLVKILV